MSKRPSAPVEAPTLTAPTLSRLELRVLLCIASRDGIFEDDLPELTQRVARAFPDDPEDAAGDDGLRAVLTRRPRLTGEVEVMPIRELIRRLRDPHYGVEVAHLVEGGDPLLEDQQVRALDTRVPVRLSATALYLGRRRDGQTQRAYAAALELAKDPTEQAKLRAFADVPAAVARLRTLLESLAPRRVFEGRSLADMARAVLASWDALAAAGAEVAVVRDLHRRLHRVFVVTRATGEQLAAVLGLPPAALVSSSHSAGEVTAAARADADCDGSDGREVLRAFAAHP